MYLAYCEHFVEASSDELISEVNLEVYILRSVDNCVDELETGKLEHGVVCLPQRHQDGVETVDVAQLPVDCDRLQDSIVTERERETGKSHDPSSREDNGSVCKEKINRQERAHPSATRQTAAVTRSTSVIMLSLKGSIPLTRMMSPCSLCSIFVSPN